MVAGQRQSSLMSSLTTDRGNYLKGVALMAAATLLLSLSGVFVRLMTTNDPWLINGYRAGSMSIALLAFLLAVYGRQTWSRFAAIERRALLAVSLFFAVGSTLYVIAMSRTTIANVACLTATAPVFAAILAWLLIGERSGRMAWIAMAVALLGIYAVFRDEVGIGDPVGNVVALATAGCFAGQAVVVRQHRSTDLVPAVLVGGVIVATGIPLLRGLPAVEGRDLLLILAMGVVQLAAPIVLYVRAARHVPAVHMVLIGLLDVLFNPLWAWIGAGEAPTANAIVGGGIIVAAVVLVVLGRRRAPAALAPSSAAES
jgi:drug/metabolite transporter (DMT)-like permease